MFLTIVGIVVTTLIAIVSTITDDKSRWLKTLLGILTICGLTVGIVSTVIESKEKDKERDDARRRADETQGKLDDAKQQLANLNNTLLLVQVTVGDLGKLSALSGTQKYYVRIAVDTSYARLKPFKDSINNQFKGASENEVCIREPRQGSRNYELVFGQNLTIVAAEVFHRLAMSHELTPKDKDGNPEVAAIEPEIPTKCL